MSLKGFDPPSEREIACLKAMICPACAAPLETFAEDSVMGTRCTGCDWAVVATNPHSRAMDQTIYTFAISGDPNDTEHVRLLARILEVNVIKAKRLLQNGAATLRGRSRQIHPKVEMLRVSRLTFCESPKYPHHPEG